MKTLLTMTAAPEPGRYAGTVDGHPALFIVETTAVYAWWLADGGRAPKHDALDVIDGRFAWNRTTTFGRRSA